MISGATIPAESRSPALRYYYRNKAKCIANSNRWWREHPEKLRQKWRRHSTSQTGKAKAKRYREKYSAKVRARRIKWQKDNWKHRQAYVKRYYEQHKEKLKQRSREWVRNNHDRMIFHSAKRRMLKNTAVNPQSIKEFCARVKSNKQVVCYYCSKKISSRKIHFDHIVPLSKGGAHSVDNLCISCASCNLSKRATPIQDWYKLGQQILSL